MMPLLVEVAVQGVDSFIGVSSIGDLPHTGSRNPDAMSVHCLRIDPMIRFLMRDRGTVSNEDTVSDDP